MLTGIVNSLIALAGQLGYMGIIFIVGLEYACFPIPSEVVLPFVGMSVAGGEFTYLGALFASAIGGLIGSWICYLIGYIGGAPFIQWTVRKWPKTKKTTIALEKWFARYGNMAVLLTRIVPLTRTYISILAGAEKLNMATFTIYSFVGMMAWNIVLITLGYFVGDNMALIESLVSRYSLVVGVGAVIGLGLWLVKFKKKNVTKAR